MAQSENSQDASRKGAKGAKGNALRSINRKFTQIIADKDSDISPQRRRGRRELKFCLSGDDDKQIHISFEAGSPLKGT